MRFVRNFISKRFLKSFELEGNKIHEYNYGYAPYAYCIKWNGPTALGQRKNATKLSKLEESGGWTKHNKIEKISDIVSIYADYDEKSYQTVKQKIRNDFGSVRTGPPLQFFEEKLEDRFCWSKNKTEFDPLFQSWLVRTLLYVVQGVESNIELAHEKMYFRDVQEQFHITNYKIPGDHLMTRKQYKENLDQFHVDIQKKAEMPPICTPRPEINISFEHKSNLFEHVDGSDLLMTDVSPSKQHGTRQVILREKKTGKLRYANWDERNRRLQAYYPTKYRSLDLPAYIDPDHPEFDTIMDNFLRNFEWKGAMQIMEAAISHYDLNDAKYERVKNALNSKLFDGGHFDYLYATRHGGQFIFHILKTGNVEKYLEHLTVARGGPARVQELRTLLVLLELTKLPHEELLNLTPENIKEYLDLIFVPKHFETELSKELTEQEGSILSLLGHFLTYDDRYLLNEFPDYKEYLNFQN